MRLRTWIMAGVLAVALLGALSILASRPLSPSLTNETNGSSTLAESGKREISIFFPNTKLDPAVSCTTVFPVSRTVDDTPSILRSALEELLKGPTAEERKAGYITEIAQDAKIQSILSDEGDVAVDFDPTVNPGGGSCRVTAIRAQITQTLKQFASVRNVLITSNGKSDILEP